MTKAKGIKVVWAVEYLDCLEFSCGHSKKLATGRAKALTKLVPKDAPYRVVKFVRVDSSEGGK